MPWIQNKVKTGWGQAQTMLCPGYRLLTAGVSCKMWQYTWISIISGTNVGISVWSPKSVQGACSLSPSKEKTRSVSFPSTRQCECPSYRPVFISTRQQPALFFSGTIIQKYAKVPPVGLEYKMRRNLCGAKKKRRCIFGDWNDSYFG